MVATSEESVFLPQPPTRSTEVEYLFSFSSYLDEKCLHVGDFVLRRDVLLHCMLGPPDRHQDKRVGEDDDGAGDDVTEEEEADDVDHGRCVVAGRVPVDAAGSAVRL